MEYRCSGLPVLNGNLAGYLPFFFTDINDTKLIVKLAII